MDNFNHDPHAQNAMIDTAENVAAKYQIGTQEQHSVGLLRFHQYQDAVADNYAFQRRYMSLPFEIPDERYRKSVGTLKSDEGITNVADEGLA